MLQFTYHLGTGVGCGEEIRLFRGPSNRVYIVDRDFWFFLREIGEHVAGSEVPWSCRFGSKSD